MITGEIFISTTWAASTSYVPFGAYMRNAQDYQYLRTLGNRGIFATTAYIQGMFSLSYSTLTEGIVVDLATGATTVYPGRVSETKVRKLKALLTSPNRSGVQVSSPLVRGNRLVFRYVALGELVKP